MEHHGKVAIITGGGRGFGKAFGHALAVLGANVYLLDIDHKAAEAAAVEIQGVGGLARGLACDVTDEEQFRAIIGEIVVQHGGVDILINNAGLHSAEYNESVAKLGIEKVRRMFDVNILGVLIGSVAVKEAMSGRSGPAIVNVSSVGAYQCGTIYGVSKLAVIGLTMNLAREFASEGIRVNAIAPGMIMTDTVAAEFPPQAIAMVRKQQYLDQAGEEADVIEAMLYLVSSRSKFTTGETLRISGGMGASV
jgi:NAD(P)-dependent dehydrogenase (short-subunit alcohol dehydrogenase family)